ncbi:MAG: outer membrane protein assembly factor BamE [Burkholderiales bacterium]|nr:outer membrane protein assembly factor BamE [Burkholderiales bacterium]MDE2159855.1 outer membrane protein assembly factor BamE [Burkholderiales bacterium]MDE2501441.1 outer membrane protein assembly factor BamE [Burkholderiales bacterium]
MDFMRTTGFIGSGALFAALGLALVLLAGCDRQRVGKLEEGVATEAQVRQQFGSPDQIEVESDGTRVLSYPRQPEGWTNYEIRIGPDGKMSSLRQLLNEDNFARVQPGMRSMDVRRMLGKPAQTRHYDLKNETVIDWRFKQRGQESKLFSVTFGADAKVLSTAIGDDPREMH